MSDQEEQEDELLALSSIYDNVLKVNKEGDLNGGELMAFPVLPDTFSVKICKTNKEADTTSSEQELHKIRYLPPIVLNFILPEDYPSKTAPQFTLACKWLNRHQLTKLCQRLDSIWEENEGCVVLFMWNTFLQDELLDFLELESPLELAKVINPRRDSDLELDVRGVQEVSSQAQLLPVLLDFNKQERLRQFEKSSFTCKVCFGEKTGVHCMMFYDCDHVYCNDCMKEYFSVHIDDGNSCGLECPDDKCESKAHPTQVQKLVAPELFSKYDAMLLQTSLDSMLDVTYCPRPTCQSVVLMEKDNTMASCPVCCFVFCTMCKFVYHGVSPCKLKRDHLLKLRTEYLAADPDTKRVMEKRYGKKNLQQALEESFSTEWLNTHSKKCPGCYSHIQKIDGCNKMTCMKCRAYFCWLCGERISRGNPYTHFNTPGAGCYNKLFDGVALDDMDDWWEDDYD